MSNESTNTQATITENQGLLADIANLAGDGVAAVSDSITGVMDS